MTQMPARQRPGASLVAKLARTMLLWALLAALVPVRAEDKPVSEDSRYTTLLREVADIQSFLTSFLGAVDAAGEWKHKVSVKRIVEGRTEWETVDRTEVLDPYVVDDDALYRAVTADANRRTGVAQAYAWLKGVIEKVRSRAQLGDDEAAPELRGKVQDPETGKAEPVEDLAFMDALIKDPQTLMVIPPATFVPAEMPTKTELAPARTNEEEKRKPAMPVYLSRQRCEICTSVIMRKLSGAPHLCAGMEYYFDTCNDVLVSLLHWAPNVAFWAQTGGCDRAQEAGGFKRMKPCPPHVVCSWLVSPNYHAPFCPWDGAWRAPGVEDSLKGALAKQGAGALQPS